MNTRIKEVRKAAKMNQDEFADALGLTKNFISLVETGGRTPSDRTISDICRILSVNEDWLRTGNGEKYIQKTRQQQIGEFINDVLEEENESFRKRLIEALSTLDRREWEVLEKVATKLIGK